MSDEEDYMSDKFLALSEEIAAPSLIFRRSDKRELNLVKKKAEMKERNKPIYMKEHERREEGLTSAIAADNKGFEMLKKMGYKPGQGIGKMESGIIEPIAIEVKADRHGLGKGKQKEALKKKNTNTHLEDTKISDFRGRIFEQKMEQMFKRDLKKSQIICFQLDTQAKVENPHESWFWFKNPSENEETNESENDKELDKDDTFSALIIKERLDILTTYLRKKYFYCIWCAVQYDDEDDLRDNCPGASRNDH